MLCILNIGRAGAMGDRSVGGLAIIEYSVVSKTVMDGYCNMPRALWCYVT